MTSTRCAVCKYFRRRCPPDCIFAPHFLNHNLQRFTCVHKIYGASNIGKLLQDTPMQLRADAVESLYYEAKCRLRDPVYGCAGIIWSLHQQIQIAQRELAQVQAEIAFLDANVAVEDPTPSSVEPLVQENGVEYGLDIPYDYWFY
ncbi:putative transcription factor AS2-LOB family [Helianthus debilis subsp. tardiflorus]